MFSYVILLACGIGNVFARQIGDSCRIGETTEFGICQEVIGCPILLESVKNGLYQPKDVICGWSPQVEGNHPIVCCQNFINLRTSLPNIIDISPPSGYYQKRNLCKNQVLMSPRPAPWNPFGFGKGRYHQHGVGGKNAEARFTSAMALIGKTTEAGNDWFCDGALINARWVLTAAHCIVRIADIVRLGEYDTDDIVYLIDDKPRDYGVKQILIYPAYKLYEGYHDIALIELNDTVDYTDNIVSPICLPWSNRKVFPDINNTMAILTGWGSTRYGGRKSSVLQEVEVSVFDTAVCNKSYSNLHDFRTKWPRGMTAETTLCAGDKDGLKDACNGDSGAPIIYQDYSDSWMLLGIVSKGHGCGLKEYPGLYTPIMNAEHLTWIKENAFKPKKK